MKKRPFSPLLFLASLGAGGIAIIPFAFLNYTFEHGSGLVKISQIGHGSLPLASEIYFRALEAVMLGFASIHIILTILFAVQLFKWLAEKKHVPLLSNPLKNAAILAPFISITMTMNVGIGPIRYFIPAMAENLQAFMLPALVFWSAIWVALMYTEISLLRTSFEKSFDISKINFGWLLHPFALGMLTVTGTGIAAMASNATVSHIAAFMSLISGSMGLFLLIVKMITLFKSHFAAPGLTEERQFLPGFLIVIPNITLYAISMFRFGHYLEHQHGFEMGPYFLIVMTAAFAFETWYLLFGLSLLKDYFKKHFHKEYYVSQWGLVCPVVAYAVLGSFVHKVFISNDALYVLVLATMIAAITLFFTLLKKQCSCNCGKHTNLQCS